MKIKPEYSLSYDLDLIYIERTLPDGTKQDVCPISETAAMAWEGFAEGIDRQRLIQDIINEFSGADETQVAAELDMLAQQLIALGYAEED